MSQSTVKAADGLRLPLVGIRLHKPGRGSLAWYAGLGAMTALEVIEWPLAVVVGVSHALATHARDPKVREAAQGAEASA